MYKILSGLGSPCELVLWWQFAWTADSGRVSVFRAVARRLVNKGWWAPGSPLRWSLHYRGPIAGYFILPAWLTAFCFDIVARLQHVFGCCHLGNSRGRDGSGLICVFAEFTCATVANSRQIEWNERLLGLFRGKPRGSSREDPAFDRLVPLIRARSKAPLGLMASYQVKPRSFDF